jgi:hypothetical protein
MSLTTTVTSNLPGGASAYPLTGGASSSNETATQLLDELQEIMQALEGASGAGGAAGEPGASGAGRPPTGGLPTTGGLPGAMGGLPTTGGLPGAMGGLPMTGGAMPGTSNINLSNVQLQTGTSNSGTNLTQGPRNLDGSSDLYLPQKNGSESHVGKQMPDGSIQFDNEDAAKSVLGKGSTLLDTLDGKLKHHSNGTVTLAAGASQLTGGNLPAPT